MATGCSVEDAATKVLESYGVPQVGTIVPPESTEKMQWTEVVYEDSELKLLAAAIGISGLEPAEFMRKVVVVAARTVVENYVKQIQELLAEPAA